MRPSLGLRIRAMVHSVVRVATRHTPKSGGPVGVSAGARVWLGWLAMAVCSLVLVGVHGDVREAGASPSSGAPALICGGSGSFGGSFVKSDGWQLTQARVWVESGEELTLATAGEAEYQAWVWTWRVGLYVRPRVLEVDGSQIVSFADENQSDSVQGSNGLPPRPPTYGWSGPSRFRFVGSSGRCFGSVRELVGSVL
jgi:hypothetical protein